MSALLAEVDRLYEGCVMTPRLWHDQAFADWAESLASGYEMDRPSARGIRRVLSAARRLVTFWMANAEGKAPEDWRSRVDIAMGARAWRPQLELAEHLLETSPDERTFGVVATLFPVVRNQPFMDGITYETWAEGHAKT